MTTQRKTTYSTPVTETMRQHVSIRHYTDEPIPDEMLREILNSARRGAPTSSNMQAYSIIVVRDPEKKKQLAVLAGNQKHIETCAVFLLICADIHRLEQAAAMHGEKIARNLENFLVSSVDAALVGMSIATAAESFALGHVMIGGMRNHPKKVGELLSLPDGVYGVYGMCLGFPDEDAPQKPRMSEELIIHYEQYDDSKTTELLKQYDKDLAEHYQELGRNLSENAWTGVIAERFSNPRRPEMKQTLEDMGFVID
jgi:FMN reductase (NADPH)